ncbi:hypothetical protein [uncultured Alcanivorax sp.]|uniref:hypothetical protein n=1 Tax=uncultured Alcanivorax sp. TaxID=191215 RepID=UPI0026393F2C|nr:hypothetical protein [uncultured Alcanivorax sp.]
MSMPESMKEELQAWNGGDGIDLETWLDSAGDYSLAVGYTEIFCPKFVEHKGYILAAEEPLHEEYLRNLKGFESREGATPKSVEWVMNHFHLSFIHLGSKDISPDKLVFLGNALKETYEARLSYFFPDKPCIVEFHIPDDQYNFEAYQITFWQAKHDQSA